MVLTSPIALQDSFEDAQDTVPDTSSIRSLTRRTSPKPQPTEPESNHDKDQPQDDQTKSTPAAEPQVNTNDGTNDTKDEFEEVDNTVSGEDNEQSLAQPGRPSISPSQRLSLASNGQLAEVSLDDEAPTREKGSSPAQLTPRGENCPDKKCISRSRARSRGGQDEPQRERA